MSPIPVQTDAKLFEKANLPGATSPIQSRFRIKAAQESEEPEPYDSEELDLATTSQQELPQFNESPKQHDSIANRLIDSPFASRPFEKPDSTDSLRGELEKLGVEITKETNDERDLPCTPKKLYRRLDSRQIFGEPHPDVKTYSYDPKEQLQYVLNMRPSWFPMLQELERADVAEYEIRFEEAAQWFAAFQFLESQMAQDSGDWEHLFDLIRHNIDVWYQRMIPGCRFATRTFLPANYNAYVGEWQAVWVVRDVLDSLKPHNSGLNTSMEFANEVHEDFDLYRNQLKSFNKEGKEDQERIHKIFLRWNELNGLAGNVHDEYFGTTLHRAFQEVWPEEDELGTVAFSKLSFKGRVKQSQDML